MNHHTHFPIRIPEDISEFTETTASFQGSLIEETYWFRDEGGYMSPVNRESFIQKLHQVQQDPEAPPQEARAEVRFSGGVPCEMHCDLVTPMERREAPTGEEAQSGREGRSSQEAQLVEELPF